jgi:hypothetical protein
MLCLAVESTDLEGANLKAADSEGATPASLYGNWRALSYFGARQPPTLPYDNLFTLVAYWFKIVSTLFTIPGLPVTILQSKLLVKGLQTVRTPRHRRAVACPITHPILWKCLWEILVFDHVGTQIGMLPQARDEFGFAVQVMEVRNASVYHHLPSAGVVRSSTCSDGPESVDKVADI